MLQIEVSQSGDNNVYVHWYHNSRYVDADTSGHFYEPILQAIDGFNFCGPDVLSASHETAKTELKDFQNSPLVRIYQARVLGV